MDPPETPRLSNDRSNRRCAAVTGDYICAGSSGGLSTLLSITANVLKQMEAWDPLWVLSDALDMKEIPGKS